MAWSWNKYRENHGQEQQIPPPKAEPVPAEPATLSPAPKAEQPTRYPWESTPDSD